MHEVRKCPECGSEWPATAPPRPCPACLMKLGLEGRDRRGEAEAAPALLPTEPRPGGFEAPSVEELAPRFPQLEILELIGQGGMGAVYKARQKSLDRLVALKIINPHVAEDPGFAERFAREARSLARLNHPNLVTAHDFGESDGVYYFLMEYVDGANVRQLLRSGILTPQEALKIVPPLCDALQYAHDEGIVHRDIKPENLLIDAKGRVKIADFGLAKLVGRGPRDVTLTGAHQAMGTPHYMAPEQMLSPREVDHRADIYSLGVTLYEMLTGELPLGRFAPPSQKVRVDVRLDEVVLRTLEREPGRRYQHASDVKTALVAAVSPAAEPRASGRSSIDGSRPRLPRWIGPAVHGLLIAAYVAGLLLFFSFRGARQPDEHVFEIGNPAPWLIVSQAGPDFRWSLHLGTSVLAAVVGLTALALELALSRMEGRRTDSIHAHVALWGFLLVLVAGLGLTSFVLHARRLPLDRPNTGAVELSPVISAAFVLGALMLLGVIAAVGSAVALIRRKRLAKRPEDLVGESALGRKA